ncbi:response regulator transcription factor [Polaribacter sp. Z022]|uniref:response regulator transcription factor n=1 Tax=Polaribacter sp. Z022 TaxID=2927125 RepID=UPI002021EB73|nr:response regulator transcription factor [Polaribacter sp. Z022]MCL7753108.1 response regulator transcription factor [Polaribacter sp. Z022]
MKNRLNILLVEDSISFAQGMELLLLQHPKINKVLHTINYEATLDVLKINSIDIIILDLNFETKQFDGFMIAKKVKQQYPAIKIMILTQHTRKHHYNRLLNECNIDAYLDKQLGIEETYTAIETVMKGQHYIDKNISEMLDIEHWMQASVREQEVIMHLMKGITQKEIADKLFISPKTVEVHIRNLFHKFKVKNTTELVSKYIRYKNANRENIDESTSPFKSLE